LASWAKADHSPDRNLSRLRPEAVAVEEAAVAVELLLEAGVPVRRLELVRLRMLKVEVARRAEAEAAVVVVAAIGLFHYR